MAVSAGGLPGGMPGGGWAGWAAVVLPGLASLVAMWLGARRRAKERRQLEVPRFSAQQFQRLAGHHRPAPQAVPPPASEQPGRPSPPVG